MTLKQLIKLEDKAKEVWVVSPTLHYDVDNKAFSEIVSVNLGQKTKYRYIVPHTATVIKNITTYKAKYGVSEAEIRENFLILPASEFNPFITECAIYDAKDRKKCVAVAAPATDNSNEAIKFNDKTSKAMARSYKALWKKYKRTNL